MIYCIFCIYILVIFSNYGCFFFGPFSKHICSGNVRGISGGILVTLIISHSMILLAEHIHHVSRPQNLQSAFGKSECFFYDHI